MSQNDFDSPHEALTCLAPRTTGTMHSGSVAWVLSSIRMDRNCILAKRGSPAPTQVQQITSAFWEREPSGRETLGFCRLMTMNGPLSAASKSHVQQERPSHHEQLPLSSASQSSVSLLVGGGQLSGLILQLLELLKFWHAAGRNHFKSSALTQQIHRSTVHTSFTNDYRFTQR